MGKSEVSSLREKYLLDLRSPLSEAGVRRGLFSSSPYPWSRVFLCLLVAEHALRGGGGSEVQFASLVEPHVPTPLPPSPTTEAGGRLRAAEPVIPNQAGTPQLRRPWESFLRTLALPGNAGS